MSNDEKLENEECKSCGGLLEFIILCVSLMAVLIALFNTIRMKI